jgi:hypothetical protein
MSRGEAKELVAIGLGGLVDGPEPERSRHFGDAVRLWNLLGGFNLGNLPVVDALWPLPDPEVALLLLVEIRDVMNGAAR